MMTRTNGRLLTAQQAAARLQMSAGTLAHWRVANKGPPFLRIGTRIRYREDDIEAFPVDASAYDDRSGRAAWGRCIYPLCRGGACHE
jgi:hypothetical protein